MVICLEQGADLHTAQLMPLPLTVSCFSKIQIGFTFLVPVHLDSHGKTAVKRVCVTVTVFYLLTCGDNCQMSRWEDIYQHVRRISRAPRSHYSVRNKTGLADADKYFIVEVCYWSPDADAGVNEVLFDRIRASHTTILGHDGNVRSWRSYANDLSV